MGRILERIDTTTKSTTGSAKDNLFIGNRLKKIRDDFYGGLMILAGGDILQYNELKKISVNDYLIKLDDFVTRLEVNKK